MIIFVFLIVYYVFVFGELYEYVSNRTAVVRVISGHWGYNSCPNSCANTVIWLQIVGRKEGGTSLSAAGRNPIWNSDAITFDNVLESELSLRIEMTLVSTSISSVFEVNLTDFQHLYENEAENETISVNDNSVTIEAVVVCSLENCVERKPQSKLGSCLSKPLESSGCYMQMLNGELVASCAEDCTSSNHTEISGERCVFKECINRTIDTSVGMSYPPCGEYDCYQQMVNGSLTEQCAETCLDDLHTQMNNSTGKCEFKPCSDRIADRHRALPCGETPCYMNFDGTNYFCVSECPDAHSDPNATTGTCDFKQCVSRTVDTTEVWPCGAEGGDCYQQYINHTECNTDCDEPSHTEKSPDFRCVLQPCSSRVVNTSSSSSFPCGEATCYQQFINGTHTSACGENCTGDSSLTQEGEDSDSGTCILKPMCTTRKPIKENALPCGLSCFLQPDGTSCLNDCPAFFEKKNGVCHLSNCTARTPDNDTNTCLADLFESELKCAVFTKEDTGQEVCVDGCPSAHYTANTGVCVLKECAQRTLNSSAPFMCGGRGRTETGPCFLAGLVCVASCEDASLGGRYHDYDVTTYVCFPTKNEDNSKGMSKGIISVIIIVPVVFVVAIIITVVVINLKWAKKKIKEEANKIGEEVGMAIYESKEQDKDGNRDKEEDGNMDGEGDKDVKMAWPEAQSESSTKDNSMNETPL